MKRCSFKEGVVQVSRWYPWSFFALEWHGPVTHLERLELCSSWGSLWKMLAVEGRVQAGVCVPSQPPSTVPPHQTSSRNKLNIL
eukprot:4981081-Amphidinium_carterae.1